MARHKNQNTFQKFFRDIFTGRDNRTYDMGRLLWFQSVQAFIIVTVYSLHKGGSFDPVTWGAGLAALIAGGGAAIGIKASTEPGDSDGDGQPDYLDRVTSARDKAASLRNTVQVNVNPGADDPNDPQGN